MKFSSGTVSVCRIIFVLNSVTYRKTCYALHCLLFPSGLKWHQAAGLNSARAHIGIWGTETFLNCLTSVDLIPPERHITLMIVMTVQISKFWHVLFLNLYISYRWKAKQIYKFVSVTLYHKIFTNQREFHWTSLNILWWSIKNYELPLDIRLSSPGCHWCVMMRTALRMSWLWVCC